MKNRKKYANLGNASELGISEGDLLVATATDSAGNTSEFSEITSLKNITSVAESGQINAKTYVLHQNHPNPSIHIGIDRFKLYNQEI